MNRIAISLCILFISCAPKSHDKANGLIQDSYKLIDSGRSAEAIYILEDAKGNITPEQDRLITLASAYASYAGLSIKALYPAVEKAVLQKTFKNFRNDLRKLADSDGDTAADSTAKTIKRFSLLINILTNVFDVFQRLPNIKEDKIGFVKEALMVVNEIETPTKGMYLFKAILRLAIMKYEIVEESLPQVINSKSEENPDGESRNCEIKLPALAMIAFHVKTNSNEILEELKKAFPRQEKNYVSIQGDIQDVTLSLMNAAFITDALVDAGSIFDISLGINQTFGANLACGQ